MLDTNSIDDATVPTPEQPIANPRTGVAFHPGGSAETKARPDEAVAPESKDGSP